MIGTIKSWLFRTVSVERAHPDFDVARIIIDSANGSTPQELLLSRNNLFALAYMVRRIVRDGKNGKEWRDVSFTVTIPSDSHSFEQYKIIVPNWARKRLYRAVDNLAISFGWDGIQCPQPTPVYHFR